ncbi:MAG TPA: FtsH protease activity modulator HflK [Gammaproteobacteria bacterium]|nr:FtsH protease activity modulator HflK [Gammaproteobacteria bacterium]
MVWKEPGKDKDPWNSTERPPDLERMVKNLQKRFGWLFGGKRGGQHRISAATLWWLLPVIIAVWLLSGFYTVAPAERGVSFMFGRYTGVAPPGLHWHAPWPAGHADIIGGVEGRDYTRSYSRLFTSDGNIVTVDAVVQYHVVDLSEYLFNTANGLGAAESADAGTKTLLGELADAAIRATVAQRTLQDILGAGQDAMEADASQRLNALLKPYNTGIAITRLSFQHVSLPESVSGSDADIITAQRDAQRAKTAAQAYADDLLPQVKSAADAKISEAEIYRTILVNQSQADTTGFDAVLAAYRKAPALTRELLFTQTMEEILGNASKVVVDTRSGNVTVQLTQASQPAKPPASKVPTPEKAAAGRGSAAVTTANTTPTAAPAAGSHKR